MTSLFQAKRIRNTVQYAVTTDVDPCSICSDTGRDQAICVVKAQNVAAMERIKIEEVFTMCYGSSLHGRHRF